jgi:hypothetical protein
MLSENMKRELRILYLTEIARAYDFSFKETCLALGSTAQAASDHEDKAAEYRAYACYLRRCVDALDTPLDLEACTKIDARIHKVLKEE